MKIEKVLNNNVVVALDENGAETVLMGRGLGFGRRAGDEAPPDKVEKRFTLHSDQLSDRFQQLITSIPLPHFLMSERWQTQLDCDRTAGGSETQAAQGFFGS